jgi:hypothetical protein
LNPILESLIWCINSLFLLMEIVQESRPCVRGSLKKKKKSWYNLIRNVFDRRKGKTSGIHRIFLASIKTSEKNKLYHIFLNLIQFMSSSHINRKLNHTRTHSYLQINSYGIVTRRPGIVHAIIYWKRITVIDLLNYIFVYANLLI